LIFEKKYMPICTFRLALKCKPEERGAGGISVKQGLEANSRSNKDIPVRSSHSVVYTENVGLGVWKHVVSEQHAHVITDISQSITELPVLANLPVHHIVLRLERTVEITEG
jgi:hypothetical protein